MIGFSKKLGKKLTFTSLLVLLSAVCSFGVFRIDAFPAAQFYNDGIGYNVRLSAVWDFEPLFFSSVPFAGLEGFFSGAGNQDYTFTDKGFGITGGLRIPAGFFDMKYVPSVSVGAGYTAFSSTNWKADGWGFIIAPRLGLEANLTRSVVLGLFGGYNCFIAEKYTLSSFEAGVSVGFIFNPEPLENASLRNELKKVLNDPNMTLSTSMNNDILITSSDILFALGSDALNDQYKSVIAAVAEKVRKFTKAKLIVEGHTDNVGDADNNKKLSEKRALNVAAVFIQSGIPMDSVKIIGYGQEKPVAPNDTDVNRAKNRRVEIRIHFD
jgi:outer membrane protein OmpA-like peptidoglycan-associated protein